MVKYFFNPNKENVKSAKANNEIIDVMINFRKSSFVLLHTHAYWELVIMKANSAINSLDGEERVIRNRDFVLLRPENEHQIKPYDHISPYYYNLMIRTEYLISIVKLISPKLVDNIEQIPHYGTCQPNTHAEIIRLLDQAFNLSSKNIVEKQKILRLIVIKLISILLTPKPTESVAGSDIVSQLSAIMSTPENMTLSLKEIAKKMGYSQEHIIRTLNKNGIQKPNRLFNTIKLEYARSLLSDSDYRTADIAEKIGISDVSYFNKLFKLVYGVSPSIYRKNNSLQ